MALDRGLLVSLLGQLGKENDNEVLVAARKIAALLRDNQIQWNDLVAGSGAGEFQPQSRMKLLRLDANRNFMKASDDLPHFLELREHFFNQSMTSKEVSKLNYFFDLYVGERQSKKDAI